MNRKQPGYSFNPFRFSGKQVIFFLYLLFLTAVSSQAQSFFYLENTISVEGKAPFICQTFLVIKPNGDVIARIRYKDSMQAGERVFELNLTDSIESGSKNQDSQKYLYVSGKPVLVIGTNDTGFLMPKFKFDKLTDSSGSYYAPVAMELSTGAGNWIPSVTTRNIEINYNELKKFRDTVLLFYTEEDPMYSYFFNNKARGPVLVRSEKMFLIAVANSNDSTIGASSKKDFDKITNTFSKLARDLGIKKIIPVYIQGDDFNKNAVQAALKNINPSKIDIVIFYYSGHGFRYSDDKSKYPRMSFRTTKNPGRIDNNLSVEEVYEQLLNKGAKVTIVMSDCCNENVGESPRIGREPLKPRGELFGSMNVENAQRLFFPLNRVSIIIGTADINQLATGNPNIGGFFTHYFITELTQKLYGFDDDPPGWTDIITEAKKRATWQALSAFCENTNSRCKQTAIFSVVPPL